MPKVRIPLVGQITSADVSTAQQTFKNVHFIPYDNPATGKKTIHCASLEVYENSNTPGSGSEDGTAIRVWSGNSNAIVTAFGATNSTIYSGGSSLGSITGICNFITESVVSGTATLFMTSASNKGYYYPSGGSITEITDTDFPAKQTPARTITGSFVHFDGFNGIMCTDGTFWHSDVNSASSWTSTATIEAQDQPDAGVAAIKYRNYIILFGKSSYEPHINTGNAAGAVVSRVSGAARKVGLINQYAVTQIGDNIAWCGTQNGVGVFMLDGMEPRRISTFPVETRLRQKTGTARLHVLSSWGRAKLLLTFESSLNQSGYLYDPDTGLWSEWRSQNGYITQGDSLQLDSSTYGCFFVGANGDRSYRRNSNTGSGGSEIYTSFLDFGTSNRKRMLSVSVVGHSFLGTQGSVYVGYLDKSYNFPSAYPNGYSDPRQFVLSGSGTRENPRIYRWGTFVSRSFYVTWSGLSAGNLFALEALEIEYEELSH